MTSIIYKGKGASAINNYNYLVGEPDVYVPPPAITTWSPSYIDTTYWFDAAVDISVTRDSNGFITQWLDLSGLANNTSLTNGSPVYNFRESIPFDGVDDYFRVPVLDTTERSIFIIANVGTFLNPPLSGAATSGSGFSPAWSVRGDYISYREFNGTIHSNGGLEGLLTDLAIGGFIFGATNTIDLYHNGTLALSATRAASGNWSVQDKRIDTIGRDYAGTDQFYPGQIPEIIVCPTILDEATRQKIEGYLAHKWNLHANLPVSHPYKSAPPPAP